MRVIGLVVLLLSWLHASEVVEVRLRAQVQVAAASATVGDVADVIGAAEAVTAVSSVVVQELSLVPVRLDAGLIQARIGAARPGFVVRVTGEGSVRQATRTISVEQLTQAVRHELIRPQDDAELSVVRSSGPLICADFSGDPVLEIKPLDQARIGQIPLRIRVLHQTTELARGLMVVQVRRFATVTVLMQPTPHDRPIDAANVSVERRELETRFFDACTSLDQVVGQIPLRDVLAGEILTKRMLQEPYPVRAGQPVTVVWQRGGIELAATGEALASGRLGELVSVRRLTDDQRIRAKVSGPGRVSIGD